MSKDPWMRVHEKALAAGFVRDLIAGRTTGNEEYIARQLRHLTKREILEIAREERTTP